MGNQSIWWSTSVQKALISLCVFGLLSSSPSTAQSNNLAGIPKDAIEMLNSIPEKKVSLDFVLARAIQNSDQFQAVLATRASIESPLFEAKGVTDTDLTLSGSRLVDRNEPLSPFATDKNISNAASIGVTSYFQSGTAVSAELSHSVTDIGIGSTFDSRFFQTVGKLSLTQNLWKDGLGFGTRNAIEGGRLAAEANEFEFKEGVQSFTTDLVGVFYRAWLFQARAKAAKAGVDRRRRLLDTIKIKLRRGTSEKPDLLQAESALISSEVSFSEEDQNLRNVWRDLITSLKLPKTWFKIDPILVPLLIDEPVAMAEESCKGPADKTAPKSDLLSERLSKIAEAAKLKYEATQWSSYPEAQLFLSLQSNGVDMTTPGTTFLETWRSEYPAWTFGLSFSVPLGFDTERANLSRALTDRDRSAALANQAKTSLAVNWVNACSNLRRLVVTTKSLENAFSKQIERAKLENRRFAVGRTQLQFVIQAEDDATNAELALRNSEVNLRLAAWEIKKLKNQVVDYVTALEGRYK